MLAKTNDSEKKRRACPESFGFAQDMFREGFGRTSLNSKNHPAQIPDNMNCSRG